MSKEHYLQNHCQGFYQGLMIPTSQNETVACWGTHRDAWEVQARGSKNSLGQRRSWGDLIPWSGLSKKHKRKLWIEVEFLFRMTSPQGMDELFWGREYEDVSDWAKRLTMVTKVRDFNVDKLFKIVKLNLRGRAKEWFKRLQPTPAN